MFTAPYPPYDPTDKNGFSFKTVAERWPIILTQVLDGVFRDNHASALEAGDEPSQDFHEREAEGKRIIEALSKLKYEMGRDRELPAIPEDGEAMVETYNEELERLKAEGKGTWFTAPWLYAECYLYRLLRSYFTSTKYWKDYDPFRAQKEGTFQASGTAIYKLATTMHELEAEKDVLESDPDKLEVIFREMVQMCLWGNATDLSLLTHMSHDDIQKLQAVGKEAQAAQKEFILKDDQDAVWAHIKELKDARIDFVLDNAGFELFTDLVFADFLVTYTPYASSVVFHGKAIPWFVSDVTPPDFAATPSALLSPDFFPPTDPSPSQQHLRTMVLRWQSYIADGTFKFSVPYTSPLGFSDPVFDFWTSPWPYWNMKELAPALYEHMKGTGLAIFKGDLNYRKLTGDVAWPSSTPFEEAIGPLAGAFPLLSLRTNKADVVVGVKKEIADKLDADETGWRVNGKYALVSFVPSK
ncbi:unnamed protein product [Peniophora sp. CBMAI 1063]|nr:unnamed protein product [Peniophora sp. CBMAI 1063]